MLVRENISEKEYTLKNIGDVTITTHEYRGTVKERQVTVNPGETVKLFRKDLDISGQDKSPIKMRKTQGDNKL